MKKAWDCAIGWAGIDGNKPSDFMLELIEKEKRGEITMDEIKQELDRKYKKQKEA